MILDQFPADELPVEFCVVGSGPVGMALALCWNLNNLAAMCC